MRGDGSSPTQTKLLWSRRSAPPPGCADPAVFAAAAARDERVSDVRLGAGRAEAHLIALAGDGRAIWKPLQAMPGAFGYRHDGHSEVAAHRLAHLLGAEVVPETVFDGAQAGTTQQFIEGGYVAAAIPQRASVGAVAPVTDPRYAPPPDWNLYDLLDKQPERVYTILALDYITGNTDRHAGNLVFDRTGQVWGVDHGNCSWTPFGAPEIGRSPFTRNHLLMWHKGFDGEPVRELRYGRVEFPPELVRRWAQISRAEFDAALAGISEAGRVRREHAWQNLQTLIASDGVIEW